MRNLFLPDGMVFRLLFFQWLDAGGLFKSSTARYRWTEAELGGSSCCNVGSLSPLAFEVQVRDDPWTASLWSSFALGRERRFVASYTILCP